MKNKKTKMKLIQSILASAALVSTAAPVQAENENWLEKTITPVANPIYFEDPRITSEVRPLFIHHTLPDTFRFQGGSAPLGGDVQIYAVQLRYALSDRLALIATKDGYIEFNPDNTLTRESGWANLAAGLKYAVIDDRENQLIVTPGFTVEIPTGNTDVLQGRGKGEWNPFISAMKGFDDFHLTVNVGARIPNDFSKQTAQLRYSLQADYYVHQYFIPFAVMNAYTILSEGDQRLLGTVPLNTELYDYTNFGSTDAKGRTSATLGGGFRSKLTKSLDAGIAYEVGVTEPVGIFENRITCDVIWRF